MAILGMLTVEPMTGYDMKKFCELSLEHFWHESYGNLYPRLKRLSEEGLIRGRSTSRARGPDAIVYRITARGRDRLRQWLGEPPPAEQVRSEFLLKVFFGANAGPALIRRQIEEHARQQRRMRAFYREVEASLIDALPKRKDSLYWRLALRRGQLLTEARLRWCRESLAILERTREGEHND